MLLLLLASLQLSACLPQTDLTDALLRSGHSKVALQWLCRAGDHCGCHIGWMVGFQKGIKCSFASRYRLTFPPARCTAMDAQDGDRGRGGRQPRAGGRAGGYVGPPAGRGKTETVPYFIL